MSDKLKAPDKLNDEEKKLIERCAKDAGWKGALLDNLYYHRLFVFSTKMLNFCVGLLYGVSGCLGVYTYKIFVRGLLIGIRSIVKLFRKFGELCFMHSSVLI